MLVKMGGQPSKGDTGPAGPMGPRGDIGPDGKPGEAATCDSGCVSQLQDRVSSPTSLNQLATSLLGTSAFVPSLSTQLCSATNCQLAEQASIQTAIASTVDAWSETELNTRMSNVCDQRMSVFKDEVNTTLSNVYTKPNVYTKDEVHSNFYAKGNVYRKDEIDNTFTGFENQIKLKLEPIDQIPGTCKFFGGGDRWPLYCHAADANTNHDPNLDKPCTDGITCPAGTFCVKSAPIDFRGTKFGCYSGLYRDRYS